MYELFSADLCLWSKKILQLPVSGILDGQGSNDNWWSWKGNKDDGWKEGMPNQKNARKILFEMAENNIPPEERIFGDGYYLRPNFVQPYKCKNVLIDGVTFKNSPMWFIHPVLMRKCNCKQCYC